MFKLVHYEARKVGKQADDILLDCFLGILSYHKYLTFIDKQNIKCPCPSRAHFFHLKYNSFLYEGTLGSKVPENTASKTHHVPVVHS